MNYLKNFLDKGEVIEKGCCLGYMALTARALSYLQTADAYQRIYYYGTDKAFQRMLHGYCAYFDVNSNTIGLLDDNELLHPKDKEPKFVPDMNVLMIKIQLAGHDVSYDYKTKAEIHSVIEDFIKSFNIEVSYHHYIEESKGRFKLLLQDSTPYLAQSYSLYFIAIDNVNDTMYFYRRNNLIGVSSLSDFDSCFKLYMARNHLPIISEGFEANKDFKYICFNARSY